MVEGERVSILRVPVTRASVAVIVDDAIAAIKGEREPAIIACANPHSLVVARRDPAFHAALSNATHLVPDGIGVVWAARALQRPIEARIAGWDVFWHLMSALDARGGARVFFLGSRPEVLERIETRLARDFTRITLCGRRSPPFGVWPDAVDDELIAAIEQARPDVLWVGMTAPKQETWVEKHRHRLAVPVIGSIGAVFDFYAGTVARAPLWLQRANLEWLHRLSRNPKKMWRRVVVSGPVFVSLVLYERLRPATLSAERP